MPHGTMVVQSNGQVLRGSQNATVRAAQVAGSLMRNPEFRSMVKNGGKAIYNGVKNHFGSKSSPMRITDTPAPVAVSFESTRRGPKTNPLKKGGIRVVNRELLDASMSIPATWSYDNTNLYQLNPGLTGTFPWLSTIAQNYTEYKAHKIVFEWIPSCPTTTAGDVIMTPIYDPQLNWPNSEIEASDMIDTKVGSVFTPHQMHLKPKNMGNGRKLVRNYAMAGNRTAYDVGRVMISGVSGPGTACGKLFISYDIELYCPRPAGLSPTTFPSNMQVAYLTSAQNQTTAIVNPIAWTSGTAYLDIVVAAGTGVISGPQGFYRVDIFVCAIDNTNELFSLTVNSANSGTYDFVQSVNHAGVAGGELAQLNASFIWNNTTSNLQANNLIIQATMVGAAGTLSLLGVSGAALRTYAVFTLLE